MDSGTDASTAQRRVHGIPVGPGCHAVGAADAADGLVVGLTCRLEQLVVGRGAHHDHLVDGLQGLEGLEGARRVEIEPVVPVDLLREIVRPVPEFLGRIADLVGEGGRREHGGRGRCRQGGSVLAERPRHKGGWFAEVARSSEGHKGHAKDLAPTAGPLNQNDYGCVVAVVVVTAAAVCCCCAYWY